MSKQPVLLFTIVGIGIVGILGVTIFIKKQDLVNQDVNNAIKLAQNEEFSDAISLAKNIPQWSYNYPKMQTKIKEWESENYHKKLLAEASSFSNKETYKDYKKAIEIANKIPNYSIYYDEAQSNIDDWTIFKASIKYRIQTDADERFNVSRFYARSGDLKKAIELVKSSIDSFQELGGEYDYAQQELDILKSMMLIKDNLNAKKLYEADLATRKLMLKLAGREKDEWIDPKSASEIDCHYIQTLDNIWQDSSNGKFGFTPQRNIFIKAGTITRFGDFVGWRKGGKWLSSHDINFNINAPNGHLPSVSRDGSLSSGWLVYSFLPKMSEQDICLSGQD